MLVFLPKNHDLLKSFLRELPIHDAIMATFEYDLLSKRAFANNVNHIVNKKITLSFGDVSTMLSINCEKWGSSNEILSLTLEKIQDMPVLLEKEILSSTEHLYLVIQFFSGKEIHILCNELSIAVEDL